MKCKLCENEVEESLLCAECTMVAPPNAVHVIQPDAEHITVVAADEDYTSNCETPQYAD